MGSNVATGVGPGRGVGAGAWVGNGNTVACGIWRVGTGGAGMDETGVGAAGGTSTISGHGVGNEGVAVGGATRGLSVGPEGTTTMTWFGTGTGNALDVGGGGRLSAGPSAKGSSWKPASGEGCADLPPIEQSPPRSLQETRTRARIRATRRSLKRLAFAVGNKARIQWWGINGLLDAREKTLRSLFASGHQGFQKFGHGPGFLGGGLHIANDHLAPA